MRPVLIETRHVDGESGAFWGIVVPGTRDTLGVDRRCDPASRWIITHLPTGHRLMPTLTGPINTKTRALDVAQRFYAEFEKRGWPMSLSDPEKLTEPFRALTDDEKRAFEKVVRGEI